MGELKTNKFKVGDKVRRISDAWDDMPLNSEWVVSAVVNVEEIKVTGNPVMVWSSEYFELVEEVDLSLYEVLEKDNVNQPQHYASQSIECIVAMEAMLSTEEFIGYLRGNIFKYQWRYKQKNGIEDLKKAQWYQNKLIEKEST